MCHQCSLDATRSEQCGFHRLNGCTARGRSYRSLSCRRRSHVKAWWIQLEPFSLNQGLTSYFLQVVCCSRTCVASVLWTTRWCIRTAIQPSSEAHIPLPTHKPLHETSPCQIKFFTLTRKKEDLRFTLMDCLNIARFTCLKVYFPFFLKWMKTKVCLEGTERK